MEPPLTPVQLPANTPHQDSQLHVIPRSPISMGGIKLEMMKPGDDPEEFLRTFEYVEEGALWPKEVWATHLGPLLTGEALAIYQAMPHDTAEDYDTLKEAILDHLGVSERSYQRKFRGLAFTEGSKPRELAHTLHDLGRRWLKPAVRSPEEIVEIIVVEQFIQILPPGAIEWITQHLVSTSLDITIQLVENYFTGLNAQAPSGEINADAQIPSQEGEQQVEVKEAAPPSDDGDDGDGFYSLDFEAPEEEYEEPQEPTAHRLGDEAQVSEPSIDGITVRGEGESYFTLDLGAYEETVEDAREQLRDNDGEAPDGEGNACQKPEQPEQEDLLIRHDPLSDAVTTLLGTSTDMTYPSFSAAEGEEVPFLPQRQIKVEGAWTAWREPQGVTAVEDSLDKDLNPCSQEELQTQYQVLDPEKSSDNGVLSTLSFELKLGNEESYDSDTKEPDLNRERNNPEPSSESEVKSVTFAVEFPKQHDSVCVNGVNAQPFIVEVPHQEGSLSDSRVTRPPLIVTSPLDNKENAPPFIVEVPHQETSPDKGVNATHFVVDTPQQERSSLDDETNAPPLTTEIPQEGRSLNDNGVNATPFVSVLPQQAVLSADSVVDVPPFMVELLQQVSSSGAGVNASPFIMQLPQQQRSALDNGVTAPPFIVQLPHQQRPLTNSNVKTASFLTECLKKNIPSRYVGVNASVYKIELPQELRSSLESGANAPTFQLELPDDGGLSCDSGVKTLAFVIECPKDDQFSPDSGVNIPTLQFEAPQQNRIAYNSVVKTSPVICPKPDKPPHDSGINAPARTVERPNQGTSTSESAVKSSLKIKVGIPHEDKSSRDIGLKAQTSKLHNKGTSSYSRGGRTPAFEAELPIKKRSTYESGVKTSRFRAGLSNQSKLSCNSVVKAPALEFRGNELHQLSHREVQPAAFKTGLDYQEKPCDNGTKAQTIKTAPDGQEIIDFDNEVMILAFEIEVPYQETSTCGSGVKRPASLQGDIPENKYSKGYQEEYAGESEEHEAATVKSMRKAHYRVRRSSDSNNDEWTPRNQRKTPGRKRRQFSTGDKQVVKAVSTTRTAKIHAQERPYACNDCAASFRRKSTLRMHQRSHKSSKPYECTECGKSFRKQTTLGVHMKSHQTSGSRVCSVCGMSFRRLGNLYKHEKRHANDQLCTTAESGSSVAEETLPACFESELNDNEGPQHPRLQSGSSGSEGSLPTHPESGESVSEEALTIIPENEPSVNEEALSLIPECGPTISIDQLSEDQEIEHSLGDQFTLVTDQTVELMTNEYECDECGEAFSDKSDLTMHQVTHAEEKPYACTKCERAFSLLASLNKHMRAHVKEVHACDDCGLEFSRKLHLYRHQQTHVREKVFPCDKCGKCFNLRSQLVKHQQMENLFTCSQCGQGFSQYSQLSAHELTHAGENPFLCCECGQSFPDPTSFIKHHKMHPVPKPYGCTECGRRFSKQTYLIEHMKKKKEHKSIKNATKCQQ